MLDWIFILVALAVTGGGDTGNSAAAPPSQTPQLKAEAQTPTGLFTTTTEVKPILTATKANWVALRNYDGQDLLYVTHLLTWRCGMLQLRYALNGGEMVNWPLPPCHVDTATPNAFLAEDGLPYVAFASGHVSSVTVEVIYDDLSVDSATFQRSDVLMP